MELHPIVRMFPLMAEDEYAKLRDDIKANGQREPLWTYKGQIIDGRNRKRACDELGIEPKCQEWDGSGSLVAFVVSLNLHRRHLTASQRAALGVEVLAYLEEEAKKRQREGGKKAGRGRPTGKVPARLPEPIKAESREQAADIVGAGARYVSDAKTVKEAAPELFEKVKAGEMTLPQAKQEVKRQEKREELEAKAAAVEDTSEPAWAIIRTDCLAADGLSAVEMGAARLIFADPPYNIGIDYGEGTAADSLTDSDYMTWVGNWISLSIDTLSDDGSLWLLIGDEYAAEYVVLAKQFGLTLRNWIKWYESFGVNCSDKFNRTSRHLLHLVKDERRFVFHADAVTRPSDRQTKYNDARAAPGGKLWDDVWGINPPIPRLTGTCSERIPDFPTQLPLALVEPIVLCASDPGDLVIDPFNGSGTTGVAAIKNGRRYLGIEKSEAFHKLATMRLKATQGG